MPGDVRPTHQWSVPIGSGVAARIALGYLQETSPGVFTATTDRGAATHEFDLVGDVANIVPLGSAASATRLRNVGTRYILF